jgi:small conductance mechanosensitive channel
MGTFGENFMQWWNGIVAFFNDNGMNILMRTILVLVVLILGHYLIKLILYLLRKASRIKVNQVDRSVRSFVISLIGILLRFALAVAILSIIQVNLTGLASILSAGVLAIGLSLQDLISNFAAGVTLLSSKPFVTGDYIEVGEFSGTVRNITVIHTVLDTVNNQYVLLPNKVVLNEGIINYSRNLTRRGRIDLNFSYDYDQEKIKKVLFDIINADERVLRSPDPNVAVTGFNNYGYQMTIFFYATTATYWDLLFDLNKKIVETLRKENIIPTSAPDFLKNN